MSNFSELEEIVKIIIQKCRETGNPIPESLAAYVCQTSVDPEQKKFFMESTITQPKRQQLVDIVMKKLLLKNSPSLETLKLQIGYDTAFVQHEYERQTQSSQMTHESNRLIDEVLTCETRGANDFEGITLLYKKIFHFLLHKSKTKNASTSAIEREVAAALESVLPRAGLRPFVALTTPEKVSQLCENYSAYFSAGDEIALNMKPEEYNNLKEQMTNRRQQLSQALALQEDSQTSENHAENLQAKQNKEINDLRDLIGNKTSIPKDQVYPKFDSVAQVYNQLLEEKLISIMRRTLLKTLQTFKNINLSLTQDHLREAKSIISKKLDEENKVEVILTSNEVIRMLPNSTPEFMHIPLDQQGFCLYSLVENKGMLLSGKPSIGVFKQKDRQCVFSSERAANQFINEPDKYISGILNTCRLQPELIHLLRLQEEFPDASLATLLQGKEGNQPLFALSTPTLVDNSNQTPTTFQPPEGYIDNTQQWNEWELRKKALQMADIRKKSTISVQTDLSNFRRDNETQQWPLKENSTNTGVNKGIDAPRVLNQQIGIRVKDINNFKHMSFKFK